MNGWTWEYREGLRHAVSAERLRRLEAEDWRREEAHRQLEICPYCNEPFERKRSYQVGCGKSRCRQRRYRERHGEELAA